MALENSSFVWMIFSRSNLYITKDCQNCLKTYSLVNLALPVFFINQDSLLSSFHPYLSEEFCTPILRVPDLGSKCQNIEPQRIVPSRVKPETHTMEQTISLGTHETQTQPVETPLYSAEPKTTLKDSVKKKNTENAILETLLKTPTTRATKSRTQSTTGHGQMWHAAHFHHSMRQSIVQNVAQISSQNLTTSSMQWLTIFVYRCVRKATPINSAKMAIDPFLQHCCLRALPLDHLHEWLERISASRREPRPPCHSTALADRSQASESSGKRELASAWQSGSRPFASAQQARYQWFKRLNLKNVHRLLFCLDGRCLALPHNWHTHDFVNGVNLSLCRDKDNNRFVNVCTWKHLQICDCAGLWELVSDLPLAHQQIRHWTATAKSRSSFAPLLHRNRDVLHRETECARRSAVELVPLRAWLLCGEHAWCQNSRRNPPATLQSHRLCGRKIRP